MNLGILPVADHWLVYGFVEKSCVLLALPFEHVLIVVSAPRVQDASAVSFRLFSFYPVFDLVSILILKLMHKIGKFK